MSKTEITTVNLNSVIHGPIYAQNNQRDFFFNHRNWYKRIGKKRTITFRANKGKTIEDSEDSLTGNEIGYGIQKPTRTGYLFQKKGAGRRSVQNAK